MLTFEEKIIYLEKKLNKSDLNYSDNFKVDIIFYINEFNIQNQRLQFLINLISFEEIDNWIEKLTSRIVLKFDSEGEQINDFIYNFIELG